MADEQRDGGTSPGEGQVKVVDRRRFRDDGEPVESAEPSVRAPAPEGEEPAAQGPLASEVAEKLAAQEKRIDELLRAYAALVEDNKAFRQRQEREKARVIEAERAGIAQALLEAADDLERALAAVDASQVRAGAMRDLVEGVRLSLAALHARIAALGAERIQVAGAAFDPRVAEAVDTVVVSDAAQDGCVVQEVRSGYRIGERILRPARVRVGRLARA
jgi:molecular chaperone GrpE